MFRSSNVLPARKPELNVTLPRQSLAVGGEQRAEILATPTKIWIDLDNSPHVPFFIPIIEELRKKGYEVILTARDSYQVCDLLEFYHISCKVVGKHWGKHRALKLVGTFLRALRLAKIMTKEKPVLAVSHGSRGQFLCSVILGIPTLMVYDYEHTAGTGFLRPDWILAPEVIPDFPANATKKHSMKYPGLKEDVYVPRFRPDPSVRTTLGLDPADLVVTVRPPATEAHYHNPEAEVLFTAAMNLLTARPDVRVILLPRNDKQANALRKQWERWIDMRKIVIPEHVVDGLNLIWFSDLVISGGGTMNRESAALGVPVYSIFRGRIGAVDQYLADTGRLVLVESENDVREQIRLVPRNRPASPALSGTTVLEHVVNQIEGVLKDTAATGKGSK
ncbi:MAG: DUF354 domain-containing protein [Candidatus Acidiferrales bacterium]